MEPLFHGLIWEAECGELEWSYGFGWKTVSLGPAWPLAEPWSHLSFPWPNLPLADSAPGLAEPPEQIFLLAPSKAAYWLPNMCGWFGHLGQRDSVRWASRRRAFLSLLHILKGPSQAPTSSCKTPASRALPTLNGSSKVLVWGYILYGPGTLYSWRVWLPKPGRTGLNHDLAVLDTQPWVDNRMHLNISSFFCMLGIIIVYFSYNYHAFIKEVILSTRHWKHKHELNTTGTCIKQTPFSRIQNFKGPE